MVPAEHLRKDHGRVRRQAGSSAIQPTPTAEGPSIPLVLGYSTLFGIIWATLEVRVIQDPRTRGACWIAVFADPNIGPSGSWGFVHEKFRAFGGQNLRGSSAIYQDLGVSKNQRPDIDPQKMVGLLLLMDTFKRDPRFNRNSQVGPKQHSISEFHSIPSRVQVPIP